MDTLESLSELAALARTAGARVASSLVQKRERYDPSTLLGRGKTEEVRLAVERAGADLVIFDNELTATQQNRLEDALRCKVVDRTALILDIFAQHARTREGRTQVELAQLSYLLPRTRGLGPELSRLGGGIGTRGPGETKLEVDRRRIRRRMRKLAEDLEQMEAVRKTQRKRRIKAGLPSVCLVGYTNSGKSSLLNTLTGASVLVQDQLFSTLDSTTRRITMPSGQKALLTDTVGFLRKLPHELVASFRSTLEVVCEADLLIHVVDCSRDEAMDERMEAVCNVLEELGASHIPSITVFNKSDLIEHRQRSAIERRHPGGVLVSATEGTGIEKLVGAVESRLSASRTVTLVVPVSSGEVIASIYRECSVIERIVDSENMILTARIPNECLSKFSGFLYEAVSERPIISSTD